MFCGKCGKELSDGMIFCQNCGTRVVEEPQVNNVQSAIYEPVAYEPMNYEPISYEPVQQPIVQQPIVQQPVVQQPIVQQPIVQQSVVQQPYHMNTQNTTTVNSSITIKEYYEQHYPQEKRNEFFSNLVAIIVVYVIMTIVSFAVELPSLAIEYILSAAFAVAIYLVKNVFMAYIYGVYGAIITILALENCQGFNFMSVFLVVSLFRIVMCMIELDNSYKAFKNGNQITQQ